MDEPQSVAPSGASLALAVAFARVMHNLPQPSAAGTMTLDVDCNSPRIIALARALDRWKSDLR
jgi:hypothetical protein